MAYPGYLRYFDSTIRLLAERGHEVDLFFDTPDKQEEGLAAVADMPPNVRVRGGLPSREPHQRFDIKQLRRVTNYVRFLEPRFAQSHYLRGRAAERLPEQWSFLLRRRTLPRPLVRTLLRALLWMEQAIPPSVDLERLVKESEADVVVASALVLGVPASVDLVQSANALGVPTVAAIASWDHLTTKGMLHVPTTRVLVWNDVQRIEARELHWVPDGRIVVTGAQPFDRWFGREPELSAETFRERVGLPPERPVVLFVGSTASISAPDAEQRFVRTWIEALRASEERTVRDAAVLVRPHPYNSEGWANADFSDLEHVSIWPRHGANPVDEGDRSDYFHSLVHAEAAVGINTSAMIEAAIVGTPVLTVTSGEFAVSQEGTLHFHYLLPEHGGFVREARSLDEHVAQLAALLAAPEQTREELRAFVHTFVRPQGLDRPATDLVADAIETAPAAARVRGPGRVDLAARRAALGLWVRWNRRARHALERPRSEREADAAVKVRG